MDDIWFFSARISGSVIYGFGVAHSLLNIVGVFLSRTLLLSFFMNNFLWSIGIDFC
jgi:hypothetical protein